MFLLVFNSTNYNPLRGQKQLKPSVTQTMYYFYRSFFQSSSKLLYSIKQSDIVLRPNIAKSWPQKKCNFLPSTKSKVQSFYIPNIAKSWPIQKNTFCASFRTVFYVFWKGLLFFITFYSNQKRPSILHNYYFENLFWRRTVIAFFSLHSIFFT